MEEPRFHQRRQNINPHLKIRSQLPLGIFESEYSSFQDSPRFLLTHGSYMYRGFNFPAHRNLRVSERVENLLR
jgi:hypothetical protein